MKVSELLSEEYPPFYLTYISKAGTLELVEGLISSLAQTLDFFEKVPDNKLEFVYAEGKWTIKEIIQHLIDSERVFAYRALRFSRGDKNNLPGYDENIYASLSLSNRRTKEGLLEEYKNLRQSTIDLFNSFTSDMLLQIGLANNGNTSVRAIGFIIIGHETHHCKVINERYL